jgi:hypothetical protein
MTTRPGTADRPHRRRTRRPPPAVAGAGGRLAQPFGSRTPATCSSPCTPARPPSSPSAQAPSTRRPMVVALTFRRPEGGLRMPEFMHDHTCVVIGDIYAGDSDGGVKIMQPLPDVRHRSRSPPTVCGHVSEKGFSATSKSRYLERFHGHDPRLRPFEDPPDPDDSIRHQYVPEEEGVMQHGATHGSLLGFDQ